MLCHVAGFWYQTVLFSSSSIRFSKKINYNDVSPTLKSTNGATQLKKHQLKSKYLLFSVHLFREIFIGYLVFCMPYDLAYLAS